MENKFTVGAALQIAVDSANASPCQKSKRGVVIWNDAGVLGQGFNAPPPGFTCDGSDACKAACGKVAVHAEQDAVLDAMSRGNSVRGAEMVHVKTVDGVAVASGGPSCWHCSKFIMAAGIKAMWLLHAAGSEKLSLWRYGPVEFHSRTLTECGLPAIYDNEIFSADTPLDAGDNRQ